MEAVKSQREHKKEKARREARQMPNTPPVEETAEEELLSRSTQLWRAEYEITSVHSNLEYALTDLRRLMATMGTVHTGRLLLQSLIGEIEKREFSQDILTADMSHAWAHWCKVVQLVPTTTVERTRRSSLGAIVSSMHACAHEHANSCSATQLSSAYGWNQRMRVAKAWRTWVAFAATRRKKRR
jgi:hypothetical protein